MSLDKCMDPNRIFELFQNYIRPWLFRDNSDRDASSANNAGTTRKRRRKTPEELMEDMSRSVEKINQELSRVREDIARSARQEDLLREINTFKTDLDAIKGLLLNR